LARLMGGLRPEVRGPARLPVDRVFTMPGFGVVVTGSLVDGELRVGQHLEVVPPLSGARLQRARIRSLQQHGRTVERAEPGTRVAVNLQGFELADLHRGQVLAPPRTLAASDRIDARRPV